jgi:hypothetical protein
MTFEELVDFIENKMRMSHGYQPFATATGNCFFNTGREPELYERHLSWDITNYYYEVVDSSTAIYLHNMSRIFARYPLNIIKEV